MANTDYIEVVGPGSLAELVAVVDPSAPSPEGETATVPMGGDEYAAIQYDAVDQGAWPYMITIESRGEAIDPVRAVSVRLFDAVTEKGWRARLTSDADDDLLLITPSPIG